MTIRSFARTYVLRSLTGYGIAVVGVAAASIVTFTILQIFGPRPNPAIGYAYLFAIMVAAWWGGYGPGLAACALSFFLAPFLFIPNFTPARTDPNRLALTALVALLVSRVSGNRRQAEQLLRKANEDLERRVRERTAELEQANAALAENAAELRRANAELEQYTYIASHDLQEPVSTIALYAELLHRHRLQLDSQGRELLDIVENNARRILALTQALLSYSRLIAETEKYFQPISLVDVVREAIANCDSATAETSAEISVAELPTVHGNREELVQLFQNLLSNALKYRRPDVPPRVTIDAYDDTLRWTFVVRDNGIGLDMQYAERIFKVFKRLHGRDVPGTGMGLAICKKIVEDHGGRIWVESAPGEGAAFKFTLPLIGSQSEGAGAGEIAHDSGQRRNRLIV